MFLYKQFFTGFEDQYTIRMQAKTWRDPESIRFQTTSCVDA